MVASKTRNGNGRLYRVKGKRRIERKKQLGNLEKRNVGNEGLTLKVICS